MRFPTGSLLVRGFAPERRFIFASAYTCFSKGSHALFTIRRNFYLLGEITCSTCASENGARALTYVTLSLSLTEWCIVRSVIQALPPVRIIALGSRTVQQSCVPGCLPQAAKPFRRGSSRSSCMYMHLWWICESVGLSLGLSRTFSQSFQHFLSMF